MMRLASLALLGVASAEDKNRPVSKVIALLKGMQESMAKEQAEDEAVYNKLACWCATNDKEKTAAIKTAEEKITTLTANIEEMTATSARLSAEITNLNTEIAKNQQALDKATAIRKKELAQFNAEEKDAIQSVTALKNAVTVLKKHHGGSLLGVASLVHHLSFQHSDMLTAPQQKIVTAFIQGTKTGYAPQSGEIFGILQNMLETFEANMSQSQKDEAAAQQAFQELKAAKEEEIAEGQKHAAQKSQELATTDENNVDAKEDLEDTQESLSADQKFLMDLQEKCKMTDEEWEMRQKTRQEENLAVSEAIEILSSDDAHDNFGSTYNFLQITKSTEESRRMAASQVLAIAATRLHKPVLSEMATSVKLDAFVRVKKAIDEMIAQLQAEKADEIKHKDFCVSELNGNDKTNAKTERTKAREEASIANFEAEITTLKQDIADLEAEVKELQTQLKRAGEDRAAENNVFQTTVADQRKSQGLLNAALDKLKGFYNKKNKNVSLAQQEPAPAGFKTYKKQGGSGGVMGLLAQIIAETKAMEAEAVTAEDGAQKAYELFVKNTNTSVNAARTTISDKSDIKAGKEKDLVQTKKDLRNTMTELEQLANEAASLHQACDYVLKNFDIRQTARDEEVEALRQAKAILSGSDFSAFLQRRA